MDKEMGQCPFSSEVFNCRWVTLVSPPPLSPSPSSPPHLSPSPPPPSLTFPPPPLPLLPPPSPLLFLWLLISVLLFNRTRCCLKWCYKHSALHMSWWQWVCCQWLQAVVQWYAFNIITIQYSTLHVHVYCARVCPACLLRVSYRVSLGKTAGARSWGHSLTDTKWYMHY